MFEIPVQEKNPRLHRLLLMLLPPVDATVLPQVAELVPHETES